MNVARCLLPVAGMAVAAATLAEPPRMAVRCAGLEDYDIRIVMGPDHAGGPVRSRVDGFEVSVVFGPAIGPSVPEKGRGGLRWVKSERIGDVTLRYGRNGKTKPEAMQATAHGSSRPIFNLYAPWKADPKALERFLHIARNLAKNDCTWAKVP